jgi:nucleotide-binding universal stress UspA family protein
MTAERRTIVVGVDSSRESDRAVDWARGVATGDDRIVVVHGWDVPIVTSYDMVVVVDPHEIEVAAKQGVDDLMQRVADERLSAVTAQGAAGRVLVEQGEQADMIVVGHRGSSRAALVLGSTANYVLHHTAKPVVVIRGAEIRPPRRIVVGVDDHELRTEGENASVRAVQWAWSLPGVDEVVVAHAWFIPALAIGRMSSYAIDSDEMDTAARSVVNRVLRAAGPPPEGVTVVAESIRGTPDFALIEASNNADLVVVGSRGRGGFAELILGSISAKVVAHSHCPVAVIR